MGRMRTHSRHRINHQAIIGDVSRVIRRMRDPELALSYSLTATWMVGNSY